MSLIHRSQLPLSWIDPSQHSTLVSSGRFFSAVIPALECSFNTEDTEQLILIAQAEGEDALWATERVRPGVYASSQLENWVGDCLVRQLGLIPAEPPLRIQPAVGVVRLKDQWWASAAAPLPAAELRPRKRLRGLDQMSVSHHTGESLKTTSKPYFTLQQSLPAEIASTAPATENYIPQMERLDASDLQRTKRDEAVDNIVLQYLDSLYLSGASLAYFAKGALSRARTCFATTNSLFNLSQHLRDLVLPVGTTEKRFKETLPSILSAQTRSGQPLEWDQREADTKQKGKRKKKKKPTRRSKDGLLPEEPEHILKWWLLDHEGSTAGLGARLSQLRFRETLLQLILILEILVIEKNLPNALAGNGDFPPLSEMGIPQQPRVAQKEKKAKNLPSLAGTLVDRLTIWQSIEAGDASKETSNGDGTGEYSQLVETNSDRLRDFYTEVVVPL